MSFVDLKSEYNEIKEEIQDAINRVLERQWFVLGDSLDSFEKEFSRYIGVKYGIGVNSGSDALYLALKVLKVGRGDEVITVSHTFISTIDAIIRNGAKPIFCDIDPDTYTIDPYLIKEKISEKTKAIIPVHIYGHPADMDPILEISEKFGLWVIEDACQAHGAEYKNKKLGSLGDMACFSFYPSKNLGAYGDAGMIVSNNQQLAELLQLERNYGQIKKYFHNLVGINSRMDEIQSATLRVKLKYLDKWNKKRREIARLYNESLNEKIKKPIETPYSKHIYHLYVIQVEKRQQLINYLTDNNIPTQIHYPIPVHKQKAYLKYNYIKLNITENIVKKIISLPMHPWLNEQEIDYICEKINEFKQ